MGEEKEYSICFEESVKNFVHPKEKIEEETRELTVGELLNKLKSSCYVRIDSGTESVRFLFYPNRDIKFDDYLSEVVLEWEIELETHDFRGAKLTDRVVNIRI